MNKFELASYTKYICAPPLYSLQWKPHQVLSLSGCLSICDLPCKDALEFQCCLLPRESIDLSAAKPSRQSKLLVIHISLSCTSKALSRLHSWSCTRACRAGQSQIWCPLVLAPFTSRAFVSLSTCNRKQGLFPMGSTLLMRKAPQVAFYHLHLSILSTNNCMALLPAFPLLPG